MTDVQANDNAGMRTLRIANIPFEVQAPYQAGHTISELEAKVLNQTRAENIGNNFRAAVQKAVDADKSQGDGVTTEIDKVKAELADYDAEYQFSMGGGTRTLVDPYDREAYNIAKDAIKEALRREGKKLKDVDADALEAAIERTADQPDVRELAQRRVDEKKAVRTQSVADLGLIPAA